MKLLFLDTETTGLTAHDHGLTELAGFISIDNNIVDIIDIKCAPFETDKIDQYALDTQNATIEELRSRMHPTQAYNELTKTLSNHVDKYDKNDKFTLVGYNVIFDIKFLESFFRKNNDKFFGSWFNRRHIDIMALAYYYRYKANIELPDWKLATVCAHFGINITQAHNAFADIEATMELFYKLDKALTC